MADAALDVVGIGNAIVANIGHFDSEIQVSGLKNFKWDKIKDQVHHIEFPDGKKIIVLSEGPW